jgi:hypothetical protein
MASTFKGPFFDGPLDCFTSFLFSQENNTKDNKRGINTFFIINENRLTLKKKVIIINFFLKLRFFLENNGLKSKKFNFFSN